MFKSPENMYVALTILRLIGVAAIITGISLVHLPAALIVLGLLMLVM